jgi:hypothetical protein
MLKRGELRHGEFDVNDLVRDVPARSRDITNAGVPDRRPGSRLPPLSGDRVQLQQVPQSHRQRVRR